MNRHHDFYILRFLISSFRPFPFCSFFFFALLLAVQLRGQQPLSPLPVAPIPTARQLAWHQMKYYAFVHFGPNTFTNLEWGHGTEAEDLFNPTELDCRQWARTARDAGMEAIVLTVKHHDGFCLWPSPHSSHTVKQSRWKNGQGDVLRELSDACREYGLKLGIYMSLWDRNNPAYGTPAYNEIFKKQLTEVLTNYGEVFEVWFDGACGEGPNGKRQEYDFHGFWQLVRQLQPNAVIFSDAGPDIRWVGNEQGYAAETNWCSINSYGWMPGVPDVNDQLQKGDEGGQHWIPTEVNTSIRPGWFYHAEEDGKVKSVAQLIENYYASVGSNGNFLLNLPVDRRGLVHENDVQALMGLKKYVDTAFRTNLLADAKEAMATNTRGKNTIFSAKNATDGKPDTYWATDDAVKTASLEIALQQPTELNAVLLQEYIALGQRVKKFSIEVEVGGKWQRVASGTTIGNRRIVRFPAVQATKIRVNIEDSRACVVLCNIEAY